MKVTLNIVRFLEVFTEHFIPTITFHVNWILNKALIDLMTIYY